MPACIASTRSIHRRADSIIFTAAERGTVYPIGPQRAWDGAVNSFESWGTDALSCHTVTVSPILAAADLLASFPIESRRTRLITVESRPAWLAGTLSRHGVTAESVVHMAGTLPVTSDAIESFWTQARFTAVTRKTRFAEAGATHMVTLPSIDTLAGLRTANSIGANGTLILAPLPRVPGTAVALACGSIARPSIVALTFLRTVLSKATLGARLTTHCAQPTRRTRALSSDVMTYASILAGASLLTLWSMLARRTKILTEGSSVAGWAAALPRDMVAGRSILALASLAAIVAVGALLTALLTAPAPEARSTVASPRDGVAQGPIFALAPAAAVRPPVITVAGTGAVGPTPARLTLTGVWSNAATMDTFISTVGDTHFPALIKSRTALGLAPVHSFFSMSIGGPITDSVPRAFKPVQNVGAASVVNLIKGMWV